MDFKINSLLVLKPGEQCLQLRAHEARQWIKIQGVPQLCTTLESLIKYYVFDQSCGFWLQVTQNALIFWLSHFRFVALRWIVEKRLVNQSHPILSGNKIGYFDTTKV